jgi:NhaA family Na+:H+ antiporter
MQLKVIRQFLRLEAASGIILFAAAVAALILCNSPLVHFYQIIFQEPILFGINDGLMTLFFLLVGLELKREFVHGEFSKFSQILLPGIAALGGMVVPALIYIFMNSGDSVALKGWSVPVATDIAFALGVLSLFGRRVPIGLKFFLMALAVIDDIGAIVIIAVFYTQSLSYLFLSLSVVLVAAMLLLNIFRVRALWPYLFLGALLWVCVFKSGMHATISGVLLAFVIPSDQQQGEALSPLKKMEDALHAWVAFLIMPLFALANAGLSFTQLSLSAVFSPIVCGIVLSLFLGKQFGVLGFTWVASRLGWVKLPGSANWFQIYGVAVLCGVGFTMSLFLGTLAFQGNDVLLIEMRLGVLIASVLSSLIGSIVLYYALRKLK